MTDTKRILGAFSLRSAGGARRAAPATLLGAALVAGLLLVPGGGPAGATSPGVNGSIYFQQKGNIYSISETGTGKVKVIPKKLFHDVEEAVPSPDGRKLAFTSTNGGSDVWTKNLVTGKYKNVTQRATDKLTLTSLGTPAWSPDGRALVFQATRKQRTRLYRINADGSGIKQLQYFEDLVSGDLSPDWSSTGVIVFVYRGELWTIQPDGSALTQVTVEDDAYRGGFELPSWSPDGTMIAAEYEGTSFADGGVILVRPNPAPGEERYVYLTGDEDNTHSEIIEDPAWSPDGQWIVYYGHWAPGSDAFEDYDLWKVEVADPTTPVDVNARDQFGADVYHPNWGVQPQ
jgi:Tol biopolymer transport system component